MRSIRNFFCFLGHSIYDSLLTFKGKTLIGAFFSAFALFIIFLFALSFWPDLSPERPKMGAIQEDFQTKHSKNPPVGYYTTESLIRTTSLVLNKRGGFLENDIAPPFVLMDNIPSWEIGALRQIRDLSLALRNDITRSQSQSEENTNVVQAQILLNNDSSKWIFPSAEGKYENAIERLERYREQLINTDSAQGQFYARADNLVSVLDLMNKRLGSLSQRLSASVAHIEYNTSLANDKQADSAKNQSQLQMKQTPWMEVDNVFYEARGTTWAMIVFLEAFKRDFRSVLEDKNALVSLNQIINELRSTQKSLSMLMVMNGSEFGFFPNYSLVMSSYITRANAGVIDIINLLKNG